VKRFIRKEDKAEFALEIIQKKDPKAADLDLIHKGKDKSVPDLLPPNHKRDRKADKPLLL
jgi:hypothetical protein